MATVGEGVGHCTGFGDRDWGEVRGGDQGVGWSPRIREGPGWRGRTRVGDTEGEAVAVQAAGRGEVRGGRQGSRRAGPSPLLSVDSQCQMSKLAGFRQDSHRDR